MITHAVRLAMRKLGYDLVRYRPAPPPNPRGDFPYDFDKLHMDIIRKTQPYTMTTRERLYVLIESVKYILLNEIEGAFVECGVYKGGSMMTVALTLLNEGVKDRELCLFDTFEGMPKPGGKDIDFTGTQASDKFAQARLSDVSSRWANAPLAAVEDAMRLTGYPTERIKFVKGMVEDTVPRDAPDKIALLRLDTDWYQSTVHEMNYLYPRVSPKGVVIVDDYGYYKGAREAVDEYFSKTGRSPLLHRIDESARLIIKGDLASSSFDKK